MNNKGSVAIYSLIVIVPVVLFMGMLFDFIRYQAAAVQAENSLKAAVRSVLSAYDRELRSSYGLFGLAASKEQQRTIAKAAINGDEGEGSGAYSDKGLWRSVKPNTRDVTIEPLYTLSDHRFFRQQIMEEMKVKAPVEFTRIVFDKWKGQSQQMEQAEVLYQISEQMEYWLERREYRLREVFRMLESMEHLFEEGKLILSNARNESSDKAITVFSGLQHILNEIREQLKEAEQAEGKIMESFEKFQENTDLIKEVYILGHEFYLRYEFDSAAPVSLFGAAISIAESDVDKIEDHRYEAVYAALLARKKGEEEHRTNVFDNLDKKKNEQRRKTGETVSQIRNSLNEQVCKLEDEKQYARLSEYYDTYRSLNLNQSDNGEQPSPTATLEQTTEQLQKSSLIGLSGLSKSLRNIRDEAYINEYVMMYFNNRTTLINGDPLIANVSAHPLRNQETEYILYGLSSCTGNRAAAYAELFTVRFAVRTVEALKDARKAALGSPLLIMLTAAAEGAVKAQQDMGKLLNGEEVPVFAHFPAMKLGYADYLRAFLALHSNETNKLARLQALIQFNTGIDLTDRPVYVQAGSKTRMTMWMLPSVSQRFSGQVGKEGEDSYVEIAKIAVIAY